MNDCFVSSISQLDGAPVCLVEQSLPRSFSRVRFPIHDTPIAQNHSLGFSFECRGQEVIFETHLHFHDQNLELHLIHRTHLIRLNHAPALHHQSCRFGHLKHSKAFLGQLVSNCGKGGRFSSTGSPSQTNPKNGMF